MYSVRDQPGLYLQIQASQGYKVRGAASKNQNNYFFPLFYLPVEKPE